MISMYFDTEFTGLRNGTELISLGAVIGRNFFYGEIKNVDWNDPNIDPGTKEFLQKEVVPGLFYDIGHQRDELDRSSGNCTVYANKVCVANEFVLWLYRYLDNSDDMILPISDVMYYDMVLLMDLLHSAEVNPISEKIVKQVSPAGIDINPAIAVYKRCDMYTAFDYNREELLKEVTGDSSLFIPGKKHNSLYDARVIKQLYTELMKIGGKRK